MVRRVLSIPENVRPMAIITLGYADEEPSKPQKLTLDNVTYIERWGDRIKDFPAYLGYYSQHVAKAAIASKEAIRRLVEKWAK
jgi:hypothetical protein